MFVCVVALIGAGAYAYSLRAELDATQRASAQAVQERDGLKTALTEAEKQQASASEQLTACRQDVQDITAKLDEATKTRTGRRKAGG